MVTIIDWYIGKCHFGGVLYLEYRGSIVNPQKYNWSSRHIILSKSSHTRIKVHVHMHVHVHVCRHIYTHRHVSSTASVPGVRQRVHQPSTDAKIT